jgi:hypothetical protein
MRMEVDLLGHRRAVVPEPPIRPVQPKAPEEVAAVQAKLAAFMAEVGAGPRDPRGIIEARPLSDAELLAQYEAILGTERLAVEAWGDYRARRRAWEDAGGVGPKPTAPAFPSPPGQAEAAYTRIAALRARIGDEHA